MHEGRCRINVHGGVLIEGCHLDVWVVFGELVRVCVVFCVLRDGERGCVEVIVAEDPNETPVAGRTDDATRVVAYHGCGVNELVCGGRGGKKHALGVVVAVEAMEEGEEDRVRRVCGDVFEVHTGKVCDGEEGKPAAVAEGSCVGWDDAIGGEDGHRRRVLEQTSRRDAISKISIRPRIPQI